MSGSTRDQFLAVAQRQFSEKGFYGASIASIASELGLTKQALLHHFGNKEKLYGEVLERISRTFMTDIAAVVETEEDPLRQFESIMVDQFGSGRTGGEAARLIMRELLDNQDRAQTAGNWYLKPYLETLRDMVMKLDPELDKPGALACLYQFLGAANYILMSEPTLEQMFGKSTYRKMKGSYNEQMRQMIYRRFSGGNK